MKITRIYTGQDNESHFEDLEIEMNDGPVSYTHLTLPTIYSV